MTTPIDLPSKPQVAGSTPAGFTKVMLGVERRAFLEAADEIGGDAGEAIRWLVAALENGGRPPIDFDDPEIASMVADVEAYRAANPNEVFKPFALLRSKLELDAIDRRRPRHQGASRWPCTLTICTRFRWGVSVG